MSTSRMTFPEIAQALTAYVAVPAVLLYPFGFFALFVEFAGYFSFEFQTAWYAASLVNRMIVIGVGVTILIVPLIGSVLLTWIIGQILCKRGDTQSSGFSFMNWLAFTIRRALVAATALVAFVFWSRTLTAGRLSCLAITGREYNESHAEAIRHQLNLWPDSLVPACIFALGVLVGGRLVFSSYRSYRRRVHEKTGKYPETGYNGIRFFSNGITQRWLLPGLVAAYLTSIIASLCLVWVMPAFMPFMTYGYSSAGSDELYP
jgi:hypothetical protein